MIRWTDISKHIEKNGLTLIALGIILFYWALDVMTEGPLTHRILIALSILAYGIFTQYLINVQKAVKDSLLETHNKLERTNEELAHANEKLEMAYAWMRDNRDELRQQMYKEEIGFLTDQDGRIEGVTERALVVMKKSRDDFMGAHLTHMLPESARDDCARELRQAWKGLTQHLKVEVIMPGGAGRSFDMQFTRLTVSGKRLLLVVLN